MLIQSDKGKGLRTLPDSWEDLSPWIIVVSQERALGLCDLRLVDAKP